MLLADTYDGRAADGRYSTTLDAFLAISCTDGQDETPEDPAAADEFAAKLAAAAPIADRGDPPRGLNAPVRLLAGTDRHADRPPDRNPISTDCRRRW